MKRKFLLSVIVFFMSQVIYAKHIGEVAQEISDFTLGTVRLLQMGCVFLGVGFMASAIFKYKAHRDNPSEVSLGIPILLFLIGLALMALVFLPMPKQ